MGDQPNAKPLHTHTHTFSFVNSFGSLLKYVHRLFQSDFSTEHDLMLPQSISNILSFSYGRTVAAYFPFHVLPSLIPFFLSFPQYRVLEDSSYAR